MAASWNGYFEIRSEAFFGDVLPDDIAVDSAGRIYISDRLGHVLRYGQNGEPLGRDGQACIGGSRLAAKNARSPASPTIAPMTRC